MSEAIELDAGNPLAKSLRTLIRDNYETEEITVAFSRARELQTNGDIKGALAAIDLALVKYPGRDRLVHFRSTLLASLPQVDRQELRAQDLRKLQELADLSKNLDDPKDFQSIFDQTQLFSTQYATDEEFKEPLAAIEEQGKKHGIVADGEKPARPPDPPVVSGGVPLMKTKAPFDIQNVLAALPWIYQTLWGRVILGVLAIVLVVALWPRHRQPPPPPPEVFVHVTLQGADGLRVMGSDNREVTPQQLSRLRPGNYSLTGSKPGFRILTQTFVVKAGDAPEKIVPVFWQPLNTMLQIGPGAGLKNPGQFALDGKELTSDSVLIDGPGESAHILTWTGSTAGMSIKLPFTVKDGYPDLGVMEGGTNPLAGAVAVAIRQEEVQLHSLLCPVGYTIDGVEPKDAPTNGLLADWKPNSGGLTILSLWDRENSSLGSIDRRDPKDGGLIYVSVAQHAPLESTGPPPIELDPIGKLIGQGYYRDCVGKA